MSEIRVNTLKNVAGTGPVTFAEGLQIGAGKSIHDSSGNELIEFTATASAVNGVRITNAATGVTGPLISASGETNVDLRLSGAGTGFVTPLRGIKVGSGVSIVDSNGNEFLEFTSTASAVNGVRITNAATGTTGPLIESSGETNVDLRLGAAGTGAVVLLNTLETTTGTATKAPLIFTSGTNLTSAVAGAVEYDGTTLYSTPNTSFGRATIPATLYNSGAGTAGITLTTDYPIFPASSDTITLPIGTYLVRMGIRVAVTGSTVSSVLNLNLRGGGTAVGTFSWRGTGSILDAGAASSFAVAATALGTVITVTAASAANPRQYIVIGEGILKVTTAGTIIPSYQYTATLTSGTTALVADNHMFIQSLDTQSAAAFGPSGAGWG